METDVSEWHQDDLSTRAVLGTKDDKEGSGDDNSDWLKWDASHTELRSLRSYQGRRPLRIAIICLVPLYHFTFFMDLLTTIGVKYLHSIIAIPIPSKGQPVLV